MEQEGAEVEGMLAQQEVLEVLVALTLVEVEAVARQGKTLAKAAPVL